jgi:hypothetical protein
MNQNTEPAEVVEGELLLPAAVQREREALESVESKVAEAIARAELVEVESHEQAQEAAEILKALVRQRKAIEESRLDLVRPIKQHAARIDAKFKAAREPVEAAERVLRGKVETYQAEQERRRREEQERLERERAEREARMKAERERAEREAREAREAAEREAREAEAAARAYEQREADERAVEEAQRIAEQAADAVEEAKLAEATLDALPDLPTPAAPLVPAEPRLDGIQTRKVWRATVTDQRAVPVEYQKVDQAAIDRAVRKGVRHIAGVKIEQITRAVVR